MDETLGQVVGLICLLAMVWYILFSPESQSKFIPNFCEPVYLPGYEQLYIWWVASPKEYDHHCWITYQVFVTADQDISGLEPCLIKCAPLHTSHDTLRQKHFLPYVRGIQRGEEPLPLQH